MLLALVPNFCWTFFKPFFLDPEEAKFEEESEAVIICPVFTVPGSTVSWSKQDGDLPEDSVQNGNKLT